jgi:hypothetical protein
MCVGQSILDRRIVACLVLLFIFAGTGGCASLVNSNMQQQVYIDSKPSGASIVVDGLSQGTTPTRVMLDRAKDHHVELQLEGYEPSEQTLKTYLAPAFWVNFAMLEFFFVGMAVDVATGHAKDIDHDVTYQLKPLAGPAAISGGKESK